MVPGPLAFQEQGPLARKETVMHELKTLQRIWRRMYTQESLKKNMGL
jgi:hypothetical protein